MDNKLSGSGQLHDKVAVVAGGASGIGKAIALEFVSQGARIAIMDINKSRLPVAVKEIEELGGEAIGLEVDVTDYQRVADGVVKIVQELGTVDILVISAGWNHFVSPDEYSVELWQKIRSVNLDGTWNCCLAVMPVMMKKRSGRIITIGSAAGIRAIPHAVPYSAAKHGVIGLTRGLAVDLAPYNIGVNCICPTTIDTPLVREATSERFREDMIRSIPMGRLGKLSDVTKAALFLALPESEFVTGVVLPVDGGLTGCLRAHHTE